MITWTIPNVIRDELLKWCDMPLDVWNDLCIPHQINVLDEYHKDSQVQLRQTYGDPLSWIDPPEV